MNALDKIPLVWVFAGSLVAQLVFIEAGFRLATFRGAKANKAQMAQVRAIMGASLGLLAFMLAFSFNTAQQHFEERTQAYMMEVSAVDSAYRGAGLLAETDAAEARSVLTEFARLRVQTREMAKLHDMESVVQLIRESEYMHDRLWAVAERAQSAQVGDSSLFAQAILSMIDAHDVRLQAAFFNRVSPVIWLTLLGMAMVSMAITGYQAGLTGTRSSFATAALALSFSFVMMLITDLDRPLMSLFQQNQQLMVELQNRMDGGDYWALEVHRQP